MGWKRGLASAVVVLVLFLLARTAFYLITGNGDIPASVNVAEPFYAVYFGAPEGVVQLVPEFHQGEGTIEERLEDLLAGPSLPGLSPVFPEGVKLLGYSQRGETLFLNFSHHLVTNHPGGSAGEIITVYGIVNTVSGAQGVRKVQILVENRPLLTLAGHLDLSAPLEKDYDLLGGSHI
jgi:germination protein M